MRMASKGPGFTTTRRLIQFCFLVLVLVGVYVVGANCERWCPFGGVEAAYTYATEGNMLCSLGTSNFFILGGVLLVTLLLKRAFCGYMCPIGTLSEWLGVLGRRIGIPSLQVPAGLDRWLSLLKYVMLAVILWLTWWAGELIFRTFDPCYALISRHGTDITFWAYVVAGSIVVASLMIMLPFCRWFCPLAAVLSPFSRLSPLRIRRIEDTCTDCGLCSKACPVAIPVHELRQVKAARCLSCMNCIETCPQTKSPSIVWGPPRVFGRSWPQAALIAILLLCTSAAVASSYLYPFPSFVKVHGEAPERLARVELKVDGLRCRGNANLLYFFLERDDLYQVEGYFKVEAWPGPGFVDVHVTYDPSVATDESIKQAITEPYYDVLIDQWRMSPFRIEGYHPLGPTSAKKTSGVIETLASRRPSKSEGWH
jgi:ferredoxin